MKAGETLNAKFQSNWSEEDLLPRDYSIVIWSEVSPVTMVVDHNTHLSETFPVYKLSDTVSIVPLNGADGESGGDTSGETGGETGGDTGGDTSGDTGGDGGAEEEVFAPPSNISS